MEQMMSQGSLHAAEGGMYMDHEDANSAMKDGVSLKLCLLLRLPLSRLNTTEVFY